MEVTHAGFSDPNDLTFENITILGVPDPAISVTLFHPATDNTTVLPSSNIDYDQDKKVKWAVIPQRLKAEQALALHARGTRASPGSGVNVWLSLCIKPW